MSVTALCGTGKLVGQSCLPQNDGANEMAIHATFTTLQAGDYIKCNDPRYGWTVQVISTLVEPNRDNKPPAYVDKARVKLPNGRHANIKFSRIFTDGKHRHQGYNKVDGPAKIADAYNGTNAYPDEV